MRLVRVVKPHRCTQGLDTQVIGMESQVQACLCGRRQAFSLIVLRLCKISTDQGSFSNFINSCKIQWIEASWVAVRQWAKLVVLTLTLVFWLP